jgi:hypothetical protein
MNHDMFKKTLDACVEYRKQLDERTNEVARLRELLNRAIHINEEKCTSCRCDHCDTLEMELETIKRELNQLTK